MGLVSFYMHLEVLLLAPVLRFVGGRRGWCLATIGRLGVISQTWSKTRGMEAHLGHEKKDADEGQPGRDAREPEPGPPGQQLDDVAVREDPPARTPAG